MAETTGITWADATWNPWMGCHKVSQGCAKCYMFRDQLHYGHDPNVVRRAAPGTFDNPLKWSRRLLGGVRKPGEVVKRPPPPLGARIFTCSWSDWFIAEADEWRPEAWRIIRQTPHYTYLILTKRIERARMCLPPDWGEGYPNVWLLVSAERQEELEERLPLLMWTPAKIRGISAEPLLGPLDLYKAWAIYAEQHRDIYGSARTAPKVNRIDWVITGGESDPKAPRPMDMQWARDIRDQCRMLGAPLFHKQNGGSTKIDGVWGGDKIDGVAYTHFPTV